MDKDLQSIQEVRDLLGQARQAQRALERMTQEQLDKITKAISVSAAEQARRLAELAVEETGFGIPADKEIKNRFAALTLYDAIKDERTHGILAEDRENRTIDIGVPVLCMHAPMEIISKVDLYETYRGFYSFLVAAID